MPQAQTPSESAKAHKGYSLAAIPPQPYDKYTLIGKLGHGGMAEVNLAVVEGKGGFRKLTVIKRLHPHLAMEPGFTDMFLDEARLAARLNHPHCVQTYEVGEVDGNHFLAMEYLDGQGLERVLRISGQQGKPMPIPLSARVVADALDGLSYAHELTDFDGTELKVVHRDISPQNIFITYNGMVKLLDFGIAKAATHITVTKTGVIKGKYAYIAPEQALGQEVDERSDLWSMGVVLWEVLTGRRLFKSINELATLHETLQGEIKLPSAFRPELPTELDTICNRALQRDPADRYQTAADMKDELEEYLRRVEDPPGRRQIGRLMKSRFREVIKEHKRTLAECLTSGAVGQSSIERLIPASTASQELMTPSISGVIGPNSVTPSGITPTPTPAPYDGAISVTPPATGLALPPAANRGEDRGGAWIWKAALVGGVVLLALMLALLLPLGDDPEPIAANTSVEPAGRVPTSGGVAPMTGAQGDDPAAATGVAPSGDPHTPGSGPAAVDPEDPGEPGATEPGATEPGAAEPGAAEPGAAEPGAAEPGAAEPGAAEPGAAGPDSAEPGAVSQPPSSESPRQLTSGQRARIAARRAERERVAREARERQAREREAQQQAQQQQAQPQPERPAERENGLLTLATTPWTTVSLNGRELGTTPLIRVSLPAGTHTLRLQNREAGINTTYRVNIAPGQLLTRRVGL